MQRLEHYQSEVGDVLAAICDASGLSLAWHSWSQALHLDGRCVLGAGSVLHLSAFCRRVKRHPAANAACRRCDLVAAREQCAQDPSVCVRRCHAGAHEVLVPVHDHAGLVGIAYLGQFRCERDQPAALPLLEAAGLRRVVVQGCLLQAWLHDLCGRLERERNAASGDRLAQIRHYLHREPRGSLATLAQVLGLSVTRAGHVVRELSGSSFTALREQVRLERAQQLLRDDDRPIAAVARAVGIDDPNYFTRYFRAKLGLSPRAWRAQAREA
ncbi:MAG: helix-turn-helix domain-containing protein [Planctomycetota bacterium]|jgi:AraC-like DNA-binding protein|nr:helix-turn-helix domain-containing protein [Planctomycetota bacterium]